MPLSRSIGIRGKRVNDVPIWLPLLIAPLMFVAAPGALLAQSVLSSAEASSITLPQAVKIALEKNPQRKAALAEKQAASADVREAESYLLPRISFSETAMLGNDPVYVFGSRLRQQRFTAADFALNALNTPTPLGNFSTRFGGTWNLFDSFASWRSINRAQQMNDAAAHQLERADQEIVFHVVDSYYGVLLADKRLETANQAIKTAQSILDQSKNRYESGVVVQSDYLAAQVRMALRKQELVQAQDDLALAQAQLSDAMGMPLENEYAPAETLAERTFPVVSVETLESAAVKTRPDLKQIGSEAAAQQQSVAITKSSFGPRLSGFADWEADNPTFLAGGGGNNWYAGLELQVDLFQGGAKRYQLAHEKAMEDKVVAEQQAATDSVRLEVRRAFYGLDAARQQIDLSRATIVEAQESLRIDQNRYDSGLLTITDLLAAEESALRSQSDYWEAIYRYYVSDANLELASGTLNPQSPVVMP